MQSCFFASVFGVGSGEGNVDEEIAVKRFGLSDELRGLHSLISYSQKNVLDVYVTFKSKWLYIHNRKPKSN